MENQKQSESFENKMKHILKDIWEEIDKLNETRSRHLIHLKELIEAL